MNYMSIVACLWLLGGTLFAYGSPLSANATNEGGEEESVMCHSSNCQRDESPPAVPSAVIPVKPIIVDNADNKSVAILGANINDKQVSSAQGHAGEPTKLSKTESKETTTGTTINPTEATEPHTTTTIITTTVTTTTTTTPPPPPPPPTTPTVPSTSPTPKTTESTTPSTTVTSTTPAIPTSTSPIPTKAPPPTKAPTSAPEPDRRFDGPSFIGGIVFALGVTAIGFVAWKFYKARTERNYHTL